jgi:uncharacterized protein YqfA (UPF0365 family)
MVLLQIAIVVVLLIASVATFVVLQNGALWFQAYMVGAPVSLVEILGMRFRKVDPKAVVQTLIMAKQAGIVLSPAEVEHAYLQGVDLNKVTLALVRAKKADMPVTFAELASADLEGRQKTS